MRSRPIRKEGPKFLQRLVAEWPTRGALAKIAFPPPAAIERVCLVVCYNSVKFVLQGNGD